MIEQLEIKNIDGEVLFAYRMEGNNIKRTLRAAVCEGVDLTGADLRNKQLFDVDLHGANLAGVYFNGANLTGADLRGANLTGAVLDDARLRDASLDDADLTGASLVNVNLREAECKNAKFDNANLTKGCLSGADFTGASFVNAVLEEADLYCMAAGNTKLTNANLSGARIYGADMRFAFLAYTIISGVDMHNAMFDKAYFYNVNIGEEWGVINSDDDVFTAGPLGEMDDYPLFLHTDKGLFVQAFGFTGTIDEFEAKVREEYGEGEEDNGKGKEAEVYLALVDLVRLKYAVQAGDE